MARPFGLNTRAIVGLLQTLGLLLVLSGSWLREGRRSALLLKRLLLLPGVPREFARLGNNREAGAATVRGLHFELVCQ